MSRTMARRVLAVGVVAWLAVAVGGSLAVSAAARVNQLDIRRVDARTTDVAIDVVTDAPMKLGDVEVFEDGESRKVSSVESLRDAGLPPATVLVVDNSSAVTNGPVQIARRSVDELIGENDDPFGVVSVGGGVRTLTRPGDADIAETLSTLSPTGGAQLRDGIVAAAEMVAGTGSTQRNVVVLAGSPDTLSSSSTKTVVDALEDAGASLHVVALTGGKPDVDVLRGIVGAVGGSYRGGGSDEIASMYAAVRATIESQYRIVYRGADKQPNSLVSLEVTVGETSSSAGFTAGRIGFGHDELRPLTESGSTLSRLFGSVFVKWLVVLIAALAAGGVVWSVVSLVVRNRSDLEEALDAYRDAAEVTGVGGEEPSAREFIRRAVDRSEQLAAERGLLPRIEASLERADLPVRPGEALVSFVVGAIALALIVYLLTHNLFVTLVALGVAAVLPNAVVNFLARRRQKQFNAILPDMLQLLAGTLKAGYSIGQGLEATSTEISDPMGKELRRAVTEARLGRNLEDSLSAVATRMDSADFEWAVMAIKIQREVGGNLAELLLTVADTMTQRERLRRDVAALTAEGRMSAIILGLLPPGLGAFLFTSNPEYAGRLFEPGLGIGMLIGAGVLMLIGFAWMRKVINIEI